MMSEKIWFQNSKEYIKTSWNLGETRMKYLVEFVKTITGYSAMVPDLPGVFTVGDTLPEVEGRF